MHEIIADRDLGGQKVNIKQQLKSYNIHRDAIIQGVSKSLCQRFLGSFGVAFWLDFPSGAFTVKSSGSFWHRKY